MPASPTGSTCRIAPALETLRALDAGPVFDLAFIDADMDNYPAYYEEIVCRLCRGGVTIARR